ncbi:type 2 lanthipeptide synthetase LanM family protein [Bacillus haynesii]|uniref:Type 2 lantipeptide synthetase LanM family protein n=1 Tax=Bacillus haynesii TaxID=1925021 RepID=A0AA90ET32_9BACI|nr:type 2 lanthipeptide synthetase LanM family protein [Bacillus haynesii]MCY7791980.1 type 2 lantipeptide synthetase LanM family protein [Bacillus haynesii]MCY9226278.1 type 2 lantipeptide synthetase LanM family protein [Bacillus haynesii]MCY9281202.1 type 2 lantipeptide synthetase LanM family protein [Bacillus haynesii]MCY9390631.1 type 2 lantipeptide synthetase LanM family protein [Bacillus haynesii]MEC0706965.1 type 2 lanthipeptide synthetase LanM family protein [Bacillus haynesii]
MGKIFDFNTKETVQNKSLYPSEKRKKTEADTPINDLLLKEKLSEWTHLWQRYLDHKEDYKPYSNEENTSNEFQSFYPDFLKLSLNYLETKLDLINKQCNLSAICDIANLKMSIMEYIQDNLAYLSIRALIQDINEEREKGRLEGENPEERYKYYVNHLLSTKKKRLEILCKYPVLARVLCEFILNHIDSITEAVMRFSNDSKEISTIFGFQEGDRLASLSLQLGDSHNGGRSVMVFHYASNKKIVYKPRSLSVDLHFQQLLHWINNKGECRNLRTLKILNKNEYGWQEYVEYKVCQSKREISRFYERQGKYIAILYLLNATDFHFENLIACGEHPVLIDLEGLVQNTAKDLQDESSAYNIAFNKLIDSVLSTGMLPVTYIRSNVLGFDISGLGGDKGQPTGQNTFTLENAQTDKIKLVKVEALSEGSKNKPFLENEKVVSPSQFSSEIIKGFRDIYSLFIQHKKELLSSNSPLSRFKNDRVRVILRSTQVYSTFLDSSYHPDYLKDGYSREKLINFLWLGRKSRTTHQDVIMYECRDVIKGDIPYFYCHTDSVDLYHPLGKVKRNFFEISNYECLMKKANSLNKSDMEMQIELIQNSLAAQYPHETDSYNNKTKKIYALHNKTTDYYSPEQFLEVAERIGDEMKNYAIFGKKDDVTWLGINQNYNDQLAFSPLEFDLYDGLLGIGLFYANLYHVTKKEDYKIIADKTLNSALNYTESYPLEFPLSAFYGYGAYAYVLSNFSFIFNCHDYLIEAKKILKRVIGSIEEDQSFDYLGGSAGLIIVCKHLYQKTGESYLIDIANKCGKLLVNKQERQMNGAGWRSNKLDTPLSGLSHGASGFTWALMALYEFTKNEDFKKAFIDSMRYEKSLFNKKEKNWLDLRKETGRYGSSMWCHGAAGIGMSRIMMSDYTNNVELLNEIDAAVNQTLKNGFGITHSLCHGDLGNLDLLILAATKFKSENLKETALKIGSDVACSITKGNVRFGTVSGVKNLGLMLGQAGIGYGLLRLAFPEKVPSILTLQMNRGRQ